MVQSTEYVNYEKVDEKTRESWTDFLRRPKRISGLKSVRLTLLRQLLALIVLSPFLLIIYILIFIDDPKASPVFRQKRIGRHGNEFTMYKFRTMVSNAEQMKSELADKNEMDGPVFKIREDPRITKIGKFLRRTGIDEILQLVNVLKGDMSLVGPRPPLPEEVSEYDDYQKLRLVVTPGLTCIWQTTKERNDVSFEEWVNMDIDYIEHRTMLLDIKMIFKTVAVMFGRDGR